MVYRQTWIIAYDITAPHRLVKMHRLLSRQAVALQYSVFVADLTEKERERLMRKLGKLIDHETDDLRFYSTNQKTEITIRGKTRLPEGVLTFGEGAFGIAGGGARALPDHKKGRG